jgi:hypothetical protein
MAPCHAGMAAECRGVSEGGAGQHGGERQLHFGKEHTLPAHTLPATIPKPIYILLDGKVTCLRIECQPKTGSGEGLYWTGLIQGGHRLPVIILFGYFLCRYCVRFLN